MTNAEGAFSEDRVRKAAEKLGKFLNAKQQGRLDGFFTAQPKKEDDSKTKGKGKGKADAKGTKRKVRQLARFMYAHPHVCPAGGRKGEG